MKSFVIAIGAMGMLLPLQVAMAACPADTSDIAGLWLSNPPVSGTSGYVQRVLDRTDPAIAAASSAAGSPFDAIIAAHWVDQAKRLVYEALTAEQELFSQSQNLRDITACLHNDIRIIDSQMEKARCELNAAYERNALGAMLDLGAIMRFLAQSRTHLLRGALDPSYVDESWSHFQQFDTDTTGWCCTTTTLDPDLINTCTQMDADDCRSEGGSLFKNQQGCLDAAVGCDKIDGVAPATDERVCPFHSNYLPPTATFLTTENRTVGLGCDLSTLSALPSLFTPTQEEYDELSTLMSDRDDFIDYVVSKAPQIQNLSTRLGSPVTIPPTIGKGRSDQIEHRVIAGCGDTLPTLPGATTGVKTTNVIFQRGGTRWAPRGKFALYPNDILLMHNLVSVYGQWGLQREQADFLKLPSEVPDASALEPGLFDIISEYGGFAEVLRDEIRSAMRLWNEEQSARESAVKVRGSGPDARLWLATEEAHAAILGLSEVVSQKSTGIRKFTTGVAYYMARSCIFRPCTKKLKRVLKINLEDACFPYVNGAYLGDDEPWQTCKDAADLDSI